MNHVEIEDVDERGRIVIPKSWRAQLFKGGKVMMRLKGDPIEITPLREGDLMRFIDASVFVRAYLKSKRGLSEVELGIKESARVIVSRVNSGEEVTTTVVHLAVVANILEDCMPPQDALAVEEALFFKDSIAVVPVSGEDYHGPSKRPGTGRSA